MILLKADIFPNKVSVERDVVKSEQHAGSKNCLRIVSALEQNFASSSPVIQPLDNGCFVEANCLAIPLSEHTNML